MNGFSSESDFGVSPKDMILKSSGLFSNEIFPGNLREAPF
jgi:hypothetical protein